MRYENFKKLTEKEINKLVHKDFKDMSNEEKFMYDILFYKSKATTARRIIKRSNNKELIDLYSYICEGNELSCIVKRMEEKGLN